MLAFEIIVLSPSGPRALYRNPGLAIAACRAGAIGVMDLADLRDAQAAEGPFRQLQHHANGGAVGMRLRTGQLHTLLDCGAVAANTVVLLTPGLNGYDEGQLRADIAFGKSKGCRILAEAIDVREAEMIERCGADALIAKGFEAGGRVSDTTTFVLVQQCLRATKIPVFAQGGIGINSAAAIAACGGAGVVLDSQLYLCRDSLIPKDVQLRIQRLDGTETTLLKIADRDCQFRIFAKAGAVSSSPEQFSAADASWQASELEAFVQDNQSTDKQEQNEVWLLGQDACLAKHFAQRYVTVGGAVQAIRSAVPEHLANSSASPSIAEGSELARAHGTRYPIVQGAMTRVSDTSEFALQVAAGGALPFLALSLMRSQEVERLLSETKHKLGTLPWGVGVLGFVPPQLWQEQMEIIKAHQPPFALIAGGRPDQAKALEERGIKTYLHVPSPLLLQSFIEMGSRRFIFEGRECGGHVGPRSSFVLWESMIEVLLGAIAPKDDAGAFHVLFAGGIHDDISAAMVAAISAPLTARGVKVGLLVGTAYLFTEEAVAAGAIVRQFQEAALKCEDTVLLETGPGHAIRCIDNPYKETFDRNRAELKSKGKSRDEIREELELANLGRLRIASKGMARGESNQLEPVSPERQWHDGMYMIGQVAALHERLTTVSELHENISSGGVEILRSRASNAAMLVDPPQSPSEPIAIIGMSCMLPKSNDVETFWQNVLNKVDCIGEVPATHFDVASFYDANPLARDKIVSKWGGFIEDVLFEPAPYGIPPSSLDSIDPMQVLILEATRQALEDAGYWRRSFAKEKTSVIMANAGHGPITAFYSLRSMLDWTLGRLDEETKEQLRQELPEWTEDSFAGYLGNVTAGRVANRFDFKGINFAIDAACASSLAALYSGMADLRSRRSDVVLLGATDTHNQPGDYLSFSKTHALSPRGRCHTFDETADGIVISEGIAMLVLKRLSDAERDGDKIYAVIRGIGGSSDGRDLSLTAPRPAGQALALERAYADASCSPATVELIEAHGTGTVAGDKAEVEALTGVFRKAGADTARCAIGSVKTNIGHTKATAGLASLIKIAKALHHKVLPPTINVSKPNPACKFGEGPFYLSADWRPWIKEDEQSRRRAGVSAFGFGGTNFHAVLEEYVAPCARENAPVVAAWTSELFIWKGDSADGLLRSLQATESAARELQNKATHETKATSANQRKLLELAFKTYLKQRESSASSFTLSIVASDLADLLEKIGKARDQLARSSENFSLPGGISFLKRSTSGTDKIAFLFPGQGSQRVEMLKDLALFFPQIMATLERADRYITGKLERPLSSYIYPLPTLVAAEREQQQASLTKTNIAQPAIAATDLAVLAVLKDFGISPDMVAGHSFGEYVALHAAGALSEQDLIDIAAQRGKILADCAERNPGAMAAISTDEKQLRQILNGSDNVYLANLNAPDQCIISGATSAIESALASLREANIAGKMIAVSAPFHSPLMEPSRAALSEALEKASFEDPRVAVFSNSSAAPYDTASSTIAQQLTEHALKPVRFAEEVLAMYEAGARVFLEVGPGNVLTGLVESTLKGKDFTALSVERGKNSLAHFLNTLGRLCAMGFIQDPGNLYYNRMPDWFSLPDGKDSPVPPRNRLLYNVNSVGIKRIENTSKQPDRAATSALAQTPAKNASRPKTSPASTAASAGSSATSAVHSNSLSSGASASAASPSNNGQLVRNLIPDGAPKNVSPHHPDSNGKAPGYPKINSDMNSSNKHKTTTPTPINNNFAPPPGSVEQVMLEFQRSMLDITNRFLSSQENVMLAYLQSKNGNGISAPSSVVVNGVKPGEIAILEAENLLRRAQEASARSATQQELAAITDTAGDTASVAAASTEPQTSAHPADAIEAAASSEKENSINTETLIDSLFEIVSERTGYPRQMLDPNLDLEADLGIDSIKRVEILNNLRKLLPAATQAKLESGIEKLAVTRTLQGIIDWIGTLDLSDSGAEKPGAAMQESPLTEERNGRYSDFSAAEAISESVLNESVARGIVKAKVLEIPSRTEKQLAPNALIIADDIELSGVLKKLLNLSVQNVQVVSTSELFDKNGSLTEAFSELRKASGTIGSVFYMCGTADALASPAAAHQPPMAVKQIFHLARALQDDLRQAADQQTRTAFLCQTAISGDFGQSLERDIAVGSLVEQAAIVGLMKTIAKEWPEVHVKVVDAAPESSKQAIAQTVFNELMCDDDIVEIGLSQGQRMGHEIIEAPYPTSSPGEPPVLTPDSVIFVTGGARGITAEILMDLAKRYSPTFILLGRQPRPSQTESSSTASLTNPREIKAAIIESMKAAGEETPIREVERRYQQLLREREARQTINQLEKLGSAVRYYSIDVTDEQAFGDFLSSLYESSKIDGIIHGAGIIEDALIKDKTIESFERVFNTKVISALTLCRKVQFEKLQFMYFFSSVVGRTGNAGQCDYVAANEVLNKLALYMSKKTKARIASIMWGPWQAGMAPPELEAVFASHGWSMIKPSDGRLCFHAELKQHASAPEDVEILLVGRLANQNQSEPTRAKQFSIAETTDSSNGTAALLQKGGIILKDAERVCETPARFRLLIDTAEHIYLADHRFDGIPVMPMAVALETMLEAGKVLHPEQELVRIEKLDIPAGIVFHTQQKEFYIEADKAGGNGKISLSFNSGSSAEKAHFRCFADFGQAPRTVPDFWSTRRGTSIPAQLDVSPSTDKALPQPQQLYRSWLFHGPIFQGIKSIIYMAGDGIAGQISGASPNACVIGRSDTESWMLDPVLLDSAMQLAGVWARNFDDVTVLPTGFEALHFLQPGKKLQKGIARVYMTSAMAMELSCDLAIYDTGGNLAIIIEGLSGIASKSFNRFSAQQSEKQAPLSQPTTLC